MLQISETSTELSLLPLQYNASVMESPQGFGSMAVPVATSEVVEHPGKVSVRYHLLTKSSSDSSGAVHDQVLPEMDDGPAVADDVLKFQPDVTAFDVEPFRQDQETILASVKPDSPELQEVKQHAE